MFDQLRNKQFDLQMLHHAEAILRHDMAEAVGDIETILDGIGIQVEELVRGGGGEGQLTQRMRHAFEERGWRKHSFEIKKIVDGQEKQAISHEIDHVKRFEAGTFALEIEWNNKDPFYDRDLENFKRLHADGVISIGCIITRGQSLQRSIKSLIEQFADDRNITTVGGLEEYYTPTKRQKANYISAAASEGTFSKGWAKAFVADKFGQASTHWQKLQDRVQRGVGNPCPLLLIGIPDTIVTQPE